MPLAVIHSRALDGMLAPPVAVEVQLANGLPSFTLVGLAETVVKESRERVRAALQESAFAFPHNKRVTVNLAPADLPKDSGRFDLPIALGILAAMGMLDMTKLGSFEFAGELSLAGELRPVRGAIALALALRDAKVGRALVLPHESASLAAEVRGITIKAARHLAEVVRAFMPGQESECLADATPLPLVTVATSCSDLTDVRGQAGAKRALEIAAAGAHSLLFIGPPGSGKSMLAERLPSLLPPLTAHEALKAAALQGLATAATPTISLRERPFRAPHHSASAVALVGGGSPPRPGEVSLAHAGVLFLDELPEFPRAALEALREPLETGSITLSRAARSATYDAEVTLIAAMNPCPCGSLGVTQSTGRICTCSPGQIERYRSRLSGPFLDRIDLMVEVLPVPAQELTGLRSGESSAVVRERVICARERQLLRQGVPNAKLSAAALDEHAHVSESAMRLLHAAAERLQWSSRRLHRTIKVARTIADLSGSDSISTAEVAEALQLQQGLEEFKPTSQ